MEGSISNNHPTSGAYYSSQQTTGILDPKNNSPFSKQSKKIDFCEHRTVPQEQSATIETNFEAINNINATCPNARLATESDVPAFLAAYPELMEMHRLTAEDPSVLPSVGQVQWLMEHDLKTLRSIYQPISDDRLNQESMEAAFTEAGPSPFTEPLPDSSDAHLSLSVGLMEMHRLAAEDTSVLPSLDGLVWLSQQTLKSLRKPIEVTFTGSILPDSRNLIEEIDVTANKLEEYNEIFGNDSGFSKKALGGIESYSETLPYQQYIQRLKKLKDDVTTRVNATISSNESSDNPLQFKDQKDILNCIKQEIKSSINNEVTYKLNSIFELLKKEGFTNKKEYLNNIQLMSNSGRAKFFDTRKSMDLVSPDDKRGWRNKSKDDAGIYSRNTAGKCIRGALLDEKHQKDVGNLTDTDIYLQLFCCEEMNRGLKAIINNFEQCFRYNFPEKEETYMRRIRELHGPQRSVAARKYDDFKRHNRMLEENKKAYVQYQTDIELYAKKMASASAEDTETKLQNYQNIYDIIKKQSKRITDIERKRNSNFGSIVGENHVAKLDNKERLFRQWKAEVSEIQYS